jgi:photosynthetic reaction center H subunit
MHRTGAITDYIDIAQLTLYGFWIFFFGLVVYLQRENKREGYPLVFRNSNRRIIGVFSMPRPKTFKLYHGGTKTVPDPEPYQASNNARPAAPWEGAPLIPLGDPMIDGLGPAAFSMRDTSPEKTPYGKPRFAPIRISPEYHVAEADMDPRGMNVVAADKRIAGIVTDLWVDHTETRIYFLEVEVTAADTQAGADAAIGRHVLVPMYMAQVVNKVRRGDFVMDDGMRREFAGSYFKTLARWMFEANYTKNHGEVHVSSITAAQFANVPGLANPDEITLREEDQIMAYFASGQLYALPNRIGPIL